LRLIARDLKSGQETDIIERQSFFRATVSPDGRWLLVAAGESHYQVLLVMPANGGEGRELVRVDSEKEVPFGGSPWWSPDGRYVYFMKGVKGRTPDEWQLWRIAAEGGEPQRMGLTVGRQMGGLRPHPDGRRLATTDFKVNLEVWVMENFLPKPAAPGAKPK
jgi:Tol biopolymer transport system component